MVVENLTRLQATGKTFRGVNRLTWFRVSNQQVAPTGVFDTTDCVLWKSVFEGNGDAIA